MKSLAAQLAEFDNPAPIDYDPDEIGETFHDNGFLDQTNDYDNDHDGYGGSKSNRVNVNKNEGKEHYVDVGKSSLRQNLLDDPKYVGKKINRKDLFSDIPGVDEYMNIDEQDEDDIINDNQKNLSSNIRFNSLDKEKEVEEKEYEDSENDFSDKVSEQSFETPNQSNSKQVKNAKFDTEKHDADIIADESIQKELKKIEDDERNLLKKISQSAKADITKGQHVKSQIGFWDNLLDIRIKLQKSVTISNSLPQHTTYPLFVTSPKVQLAIKETKSELCELVDSLIKLSKDLCRDNESVKLPEHAANSRKRRLGNDDDDDSNYTDYLWTDIKTIHENFKPFRTETIEKWNNKVQIASGIPLNKKFKAINQSVNNQIEQVLHDHERLVKRTQLMRGDYKILGKQQQTEPSRSVSSASNMNIEGQDDHLSNYDPEIFDDTDFYQQLLRELIENRMIDTDDPIAIGMRWAALKQTKQKKKQVDNKASKGRRLRYHVHEKLENFMVPIPTGTWHEDMIDELYASLLGKKYNINSNNAIFNPEKETVKLNAVETKDASSIEKGVNGLRIFS
ncbi:2205_t:CDS:10 [Ambispora gerdemannii]|uniref:Protein BFR2 n=1 Tax=Ambispora gerdemannii TaxID=144530 RepID=A0A9N9CJD2_9GLOM|nr:2205_t:CDS:10 [Ambispora gerdemannii]